MKRRPVITFRFFYMCREHTVVAPDWLSAAMRLSESLGITIEQIMALPQRVSVE